MFKMKVLPVLITGITFVVPSEFALADSALVRNPANNHWYQRFDTSMSWYAAKTFCERQAGYLATITSQTENDFVWFKLASQSPNTGGIWLGATNDKTGSYQWITGEKWNYTNWNAGQPNNVAVFPGGGEHYAEFFSSVNVTYDGVVSGSWNDVGVYNQGTAWPTGLNGISDSFRPVSTICEWGGNLTSTNF